MKKILFAFASMVILLSTSCSEQESEATNEENTEVKAPVVANAEINMNVEGMTCSHGCKGAIEKALNNHAGISNCAIDFENATAKVTFDNNSISEEEILQAVSEVNNGAYSATMITDEEVMESTEENTEA